MKAKYLTLGKRNQVTLPRESVKEGTELFQCEVREDGSILLTPQVPIPASQAYIWTRRWQEGEKQASEDIRAGRLHRYESAEGLAAGLERRRKR